MRAKKSAGILMFREHDGVEVLIGHMGGPFWANHDKAAWSIPKGEYTPEEAAIDAARREFEEELGTPVPAGDLLPLGDLRQPGGKLVTVWALHGDLSPGMVVPGQFSMEWPPHSGNYQEFPELDRVAWVPPEVAHEKLVTGQRPFLDRLRERVTG